MNKREDKSRLVKTIKRIFLTSEHHLDNIGYSILRGRYITSQNVERLKQRVRNYHYR